MTRRAGLLVWACWALWLAGMPPARAEPLVADLSDHLIAITTGFAGTEVLLYGATEGEGAVVVVLRGPDGEVTVRRKERIAGIWINRDEVVFENVPVFYRVAASQPLAEIVTPNLQGRLHIGLDQLRFRIREAVAAEEAAAFRAGLIRNKERQGLYSAAIGQVSFLGPRLFRTRINLPANVPTGSYTVEVFLIREGQVLAAQTTPLFVSKVGVGADIFEFAHAHAFVYGMIAVAVAVLAGWLGSIAFRRG